MALTHSDIIEYLRNINQQAVFFPDSSFYRLNLMEVFDAIRTKVNYPAMMVESPDGTFEDSSDIHTRNTKPFAFQILKRPKQNDFQQEEDFLNDCEIIGKKVISRMKHDHFDPESILYNKLIISSIDYTKVENLFSDKLFGYRFEGELQMHDNLKLDPADWNDISQNC